MSIAKLLACDRTRKLITNAATAAIDSPLPKPPPAASGLGSVAKIVVSADNRIISSMLDN